MAVRHLTDPAALTAADQKAGAIQSTMN